MSSFETFLHFGLWIGLSLFFAVSTVLGFVGSIFMARNENKRILSEGIDASAVITSVIDTKTRINQSPVLKIGLMVQEQDGDTFVTEITETVSIAEIAAFQIGRTVRVKYIPTTKVTAFAGFA